MKKILTLCILALLPGMAAFPQATAQWRGPDRSGNYPETNLLNEWPAGGPALVWHYEGLGEGHASAAVAGDRVYTAGVTDGIGYLYCFETGGKLLWRVPYGEEWTESWPGVRSTPLIAGGRIYQLSGLGKLVCRRADNGDFIWSIDILKEFNAPNIKWGVTENLAIDGNRLFCTPGGPDCSVAALDASTGKILWKCKGKGEASAYCSPALVRLSARTLLVTQTASSILGIDAANGMLLWCVDQPNRYSVHANTPLFSDGMICCVSGYGKGAVMLKLADDGTSVRELWRNEVLDNRMGGMVVINGKLYGTDDSGKGWHCLDWKTGTQMYAEKIAGKGNIITSEGMLYGYAENGEVVLAEPQPAGFRKAGSFQVPYGADQHWAHLVIAGGRLYVRHGTSLMVYDIRKK